MEWLHFDRPITWVDIVLLIERTARFNVDGLVSSWFPFQSRRKVVRYFGEPEVQAMIDGWKGKTLTRQQLSK